MLVDDYRNALRSSATPTELILRTRWMVSKLENRYHPLREHAERGNCDINERLEFLKEKVGGRFIDIGSYDGYFVYELCEVGHKGCGLDMMQEALQMCREERSHYPDCEAKFFSGIAEQMTFSDQSFDTTVLSHTLEHVLRPSQVLREAARITKDGGNIIAIVPTELGDEPTHLRVVPEEWLTGELNKYGVTSNVGRVGEGIAFICRVSKCQ